MKVRLGILELSDTEVERGTQVRFKVRSITSETEEERKQLLSHEDVFQRPAIDMYAGRFLLPPEEPQDGQQTRILLTKQALAVMVYPDLHKSDPEDLTFKPLSLNPHIEGCAYLIGRGSRFWRCYQLTLFSEDRERALTIVCRNSAVVDCLYRLISGTDANAASDKCLLSNQLGEQWQALYDEAEVLEVTVQTLQQAKNAVAKYRVYLEEIEFEDPS